MGSVGSSVPAVVVRTASGADYVTPVSQLREITFPTGMLCVRNIAGSDFTVADADFVSIKFENREQTSVAEITADGVDAVRVYDVNGRYVGASVDGLPKGIYIVAGNGVKPSKTVIR